MDLTLPLGTFALCGIVGTTITSVLGIVNTFCTVLIGGISGLGVADISAAKTGDPIT